MIGLPKTTELNRQLPKKNIYTRFKLDNADKVRFDKDIKRLAIVGEVSPESVNIKAGNEVSSFFVVLVSLRSFDYDERNLRLITKLVDQKLLFVLEHEGKAQLALWCTRLINTEWKLLDEHRVFLEGLDLDSVWQSVIIQISGLMLEQDKTIDEQIKSNDEQKRLIKRIEQLERKARIEKQPRRKYDLVKEIKLLSDSLKGKKND